MFTKEKQQRVQQLVQEAVTAICKQALPFVSQISIEGLIGITLDMDHVVLVSVKETTLSTQPVLTSHQTPVVVSPTSAGGVVDTRTEYCHSHTQQKSQNQNFINVVPQEPHPFVRSARYSEPELVNNQNTVEEHISDFIENAAGTQMSDDTVGNDDGDGCDGDEIIIIKEEIISSPLHVAPVVGEVVFPGQPMDDEDAEPEDAGRYRQQNSHGMNSTWNFCAPVEAENDKSQVINKH